MVNTTEFDAMLKTLYTEEELKHIDDLRKRIENKRKIALINSERTTKEEVLFC